MAAEDTSRRLVVVVCDLSPLWWGKELSTNSEAFTVSKFLDSVMVFCNAFLMMKHSNNLAILCATSTKSQFIYPNAEEGGNINDQSSSSDGKYEYFTALNDQIVNKVKCIMEEVTDNDTTSDSCGMTLLSGALSMALCYIKQCERDCPVGQTLESRILIIKGSPDVSSQYMPTMNCIFAAQKNNITIDSCVLKSDSGFLQQASDITNGIYFKVIKMESLLQYLLWMFLPDCSSRDYLVLPTAHHIDYRAACFCHRTLVDVGFVCSVCLSIYCQLVPRCHTCQTRFKLPTMQMSRSKKKKKAS